MICDDLQNGVQVHNPEVLEDLEDRLAAAFELGGNLLVLQVVDQASFLDQRQQRIVDFFGHRIYFAASTVMSTPTAWASSNSCNFAWIVTGSWALVTTSSRAIMPARYLSIRKLSSVTIPYLAPVWISDWIRKVLLSRMSAAMDGVLIMISKIATRPGLSMRGMSNCEMTACMTVESWMRICSCWLEGKALTTRSIVLAAPVVWSVPKTRWPVSAAVMAASIVSRSRISPTRTTSGSCRSARRRASAKFGTSTPI